MIDPMDMPCCPFCDNVILAWQSACVYEQDGAKCLAHSECLMPDPYEEPTNDR